MCMIISRIPWRDVRGTTNVLDELSRTVWVLTGSMQQGFAEGIAVSLLPDTRPLLPAHVLVFFSEVRAEPQ